MTEKTPQSEHTPEVETTRQHRDEMLENALQVTQDALDQFLAAADVEAVYGEAITHGNTLIIPTAEIVAVLGVGGGGGRGEDNKGGGSYGSGGGSGGGGKVLARPVAVIVSDELGVRVRPVIDMTKIYLTAFTALGFITAAWVKMSRKKF